jgi:hypothetical protein
VTLWASGGSRWPPSRSGPLIVTDGRRKVCRILFENAAIAPYQPTPITFQALFQLTVGKFSRLGSAVETRRPHATCVTIFTRQNSIARVIYHPLHTFDRVLFVYRNGAGTTLVFLPAVTVHARTTLPGARGAFEFGADVVWPEHGVQVDSSSRKVLSRDHASTHAAALEAPTT